MERELTDKRHKKTQMIGLIESNLINKIFSRFPDSKLSKMFSGSIPIVLDTLKQHYFIDR